MPIDDEDDDFEDGAKPAKGKKGQKDKKPASDGLTVEMIEKADGLDPIQAILSAAEDELDELAPENAKKGTRGPKPGTGLKLANPEILKRVLKNRGEGMSMNMALIMAGLSRNAYFKLKVKYQKTGDKKLGHIMLALKHGADPLYAYNLRLLRIHAIEDPATVRWTLARLDPKRWGRKADEQPVAPPGVTNNILNLNISPEVVRAAKTPEQKKALHTEIQRRIEAFDSFDAEEVHDAGWIEKQNAEARAKKK